MQVHNDTDWAPDCARDWRQGLAAGDIVAFRFPSGEGDRTLEKTRPCLVLEVDRDGSAPLALVAYGTDRSHRSHHGWGLNVSRPQDIAVAGLRKPTRFVGLRRVRVPLDSRRFVVNAAGTAVIGRLSATLADRLEYVRSEAAAGAVRRGCGAFLRRRGRRPTGRDTDAAGAGGGSGDHEVCTAR